MVLVAVAFDNKVLVAVHSIKSPTNNNQGPTSHHTALWYR